MRILASLILFIGLAANGLLAQTLSTRGTEFWVTFMQNSDDPFRIDDPTRILFVSAEEACQVTVTLGAQVLAQVSVPAMGSQRIDITDPSSILTTSDVICDECAINVVSTKPISLYAYNSVNQSTDATIVLPVPALSNKCIVASYPHYYQLTSSGALLDWSALFTVVGVDDNTVVEIVPTVPVESQTLGERPARVPFRVVLDRGDVVQFKTRTGFNHKNDLTGTTVQVVASGNKCGKIAVFSGHQRTAIPTDEESRDHLFEQMPPLVTLGLEHVIPPLEHATTYDVRVIASEPNTNVTIDGVTRNILAANSFIEINNLDAELHHTVDATKPVLVVLYAKSQPYGWKNFGPGDPMMVVIPPISQRIENATVYVFIPNDQEGWADNTYITLLTPTGGLSRVRVDGYPLGSYPASLGQVVSIKATAKGLSAVVLKVAPGVHTVDATNNDGLLALVHGLAEVDSYGFVAGATYSNLRTSINVSGQPFCPGRPITLRGFNSDSLNILSWKWFFHDGRTADGQEVVRVYADTGAFPVKLVMQRTDCGADTAYATIRITNPVNLKLTAPQVTCADSMAVLRADASPSGTYTYQWRALGEDGIVGSSNRNTIDVRHRRSGVYGYEVTATDPGGCTAKGTINVSFIAPPTITVDSKYLVCENDDIVINATVRDTTPVAIRWNAVDTADRGCIVGDPSKATVTIRPNRTGDMVFEVRATNANGCAAVQRVTVSVVSRPVVTGVGATRVFSCLDDSVPPTELGNGFVVSGGVPPYTYEWREQGGGTTSFRGPTNTLTTAVKPKQTTTYVLTIRDSNPIKDCPTTVTITVDLRPVPDAKAGDDAVLCECTTGAEATIGIDARCGKPPYTYTWQPTTGLSNPQSTTTAVTKARPTRTTTYVLAVSDITGITNYDTVTVRVEPCPEVAVTPVATKCGKDTAYRLSAFIRNGVQNVTYLWQPSTYLDDPTSATPTARIPSANGVVRYTVTARSEYGCSGSTEVAIRHSSGPQVTLLSQDECPNDTLCRGDEVQIDATVTSGLPPYTYRWSSRPEVTPGWTSTQNTIKVPLVRSTVFTLVVTDSLGCTSVDSMRICVDPVPNVKIGTDTILCASDLQSVQIFRGQASTCGKPPFVYEWSPAADLTIPDAAQPWRARLMPKRTTTYRLKVTDDGGRGLSTTDSLTVTVRDAIGLAVSTKSVAYCPDKLADTISVLPSQGRAPYQITYSIGGRQLFQEAVDVRSQLLPSLLPSSPGVYTLYVDAVDGNGCRIVDSVRVTVYEPPKIQINARRTMCLCDSLTIEAVGQAGSSATTGKLRYIWSENSEDAPTGTRSLQSDTARVQVVRPGFNTLYTVRVVDENGCSSQSTMSIKVISSASGTSLRIDTVLADPTKQEILIPVRVSVVGDSTECLPEMVEFSLRYRKDLFDPLPRIDPGIVTSNIVTTIDDVEWRTIGIRVSPVRSRKNNDVLCTIKGRALIGAPGSTVLDIVSAKSIYRCDTFEISGRDGFMQLDSLCITQDSIARLLKFNADGILSIFPNPVTNGSIDVRMRRVSSGPITLSIADLSGRVLEEYTTTITSRETTSVRLSTPTLPGLYQVIMRSPTGVSQRTFIVTPSP